MTLEWDKRLSMFTRPYKCFHRFSAGDTPGFSKADQRLEKKPLRSECASTPSEFAYEVDGTDRIIAVSGDWLDFARENGAPELTEDLVVGRSLWDFIEGVDTQAFYEFIFERVRKARIALKVPFRCDSPTCRRWMEMEIKPQLERGILLCSRIVRTEAIPASDRPKVIKRRPGGLVTVCGWCRRVQLPSLEWVQFEDAVPALELENRCCMPGLTHGICESCMIEWLTKYGDLDPLP